MPQEHAIIDCPFAAGISESAGPSIASIGSSSSAPRSRLPERGLNDRPSLIGRAQEVDGLERETRLVSLSELREVLHPHVDQSFLVDEQ